MFAYYTAILFLSIFALLAVQLCVRNSLSLSRHKKRQFHRLFTTIMAAGFCEWMGVFLQGTGSATRVLHIAVKAVELSIAPSIAFFIAWVIERRNEKPAWFYLAIHAVVEGLSGIFGFIYSVDAASNYTHAAFYWVYVVAYGIPMLYCIHTVMRNVKKYQYTGISYFLLIVALMLGGLAVQLYNGALKVDYFTAALVSIMLYVFTLEMIQQTDELTELINRRGYENYVAHLEEPCMLIFFDVDDFKSINDRYGHAFGDTVLATIGKAIKDQYARYGKCFRFGGDEFCVILSRAPEQVKLLNEKFVSGMAQLREKEPRLPAVAVGYVDYDPEQSNIKDAMAEADQRMYRNKQAHKAAARAAHSGGLDAGTAP